MVVEQAAQLCLAENNIFDTPRDNAAERGRLRTVLLELLHRLQAEALALYLLSVLCCCCLLLGHCFSLACTKYLKRFRYYSKLNGHRKHLLQDGLVLANI